LKSKVWAISNQNGHYLYYKYIELEYKIICVYEIESNECNDENNRYVAK
jgi:hypothetical protein